MAGFLKRGPRPPWGQEVVLWGHGQRPSLSSFAVTLHNQSVTIHLSIRRLNLEDDHGS